MKAFIDLLEVLRWIWSKRWGALRDVREKAIPAILGGADVLLAAPTADGIGALWRFVATIRKSKTA